MKSLILLLAFVSPALAQQPVPQPAQQPAPVYALGWQPVMVPGQLVAVPRALPVMNYWLGPRIYFLPRVQTQISQPPSARSVSPTGQKYPIMYKSTPTQKAPRSLVNYRSRGQVCLGDSTMGLYQSLRIDNSNIGRVAGKWVQIGPTFKIPYGYAKTGKRASHRWAICQCECGTIELVMDQTLRKYVKHGQVAGCFACGRIQSAQALSGHEMMYTPAWGSWKKMKGRCLNPNNDHWESYGGRGITVCDRWMSFDNFYVDMGQPPSRDYTIDRIDNNGNYEPGNCRWATKREQSNNTRRTAFVEYAGRNVTFRELEDLCGIPISILRARVVGLNWTVADAISTPYAPRRALA